MPVKGLGNGAPVSLKECKHIGRIAQEFKVDPRQFGNLSAGQVREFSKHAEDMKMQAEFAKVALKALTQIAKYKVQIEAYRREAIELGLSAVEEIDKHILACVLRDGKHDQHLKLLLQEKFQELAKIDAKGRSDSEISRTKFQQSLIELRTRHRVSLQNAKRSHGDALRGINLGQARAERERQLRRYINAEDYTPSGRRAGGGGMFSGGVKGFFFGR